MAIINSFAGEFSFLSNFFIEPDGTCVEHEFQAEKTIDLSERAWILSAETPGRAKRRGRKVQLRPGWEDMRVEVMRGLVFRKFWDHPELSTLLQETGNAQLIEGNHWNDTFWGVCNGVGENNLGKILMEIRELV